MQFLKYVQPFLEGFFCWEALSVPPAGAPQGAITFLKPFFRNPQLESPLPPQHLLLAWPVPMFSESLWEGWLSQPQ